MALPKGFQLESETNVPLGFEMEEEDSMSAFDVLPPIADVSEPPEILSRTPKGFEVEVQDTIGLPPKIEKRKKELEIVLRKELEKEVKDKGMDISQIDTEELDSYLDEEATKRASAEFQGKDLNKGWILPGDWEYKEREEKFHWLVGQYVARPVTSYARGKLFGFLDPMFKVYAETSEDETIREQTLDEFLNKGDTSAISDFIAFSSEFSGRLKTSKGLLESVLGAGPKSSSVLRMASEFGLAQTGEEISGSLETKEIDLKKSAINIIGQTALGAGIGGLSDFVGGLFSKFFSGKSKDIIYKRIGLDEALLKQDERKIYDQLIDTAFETNSPSDWARVSEFVQGFSRSTYDDLLNKVASGEEAQRAVMIIQEGLYQGGERPTAALGDLTTTVFRNTPILADRIEKGVEAAAQYGVLSKVAGINLKSPRMQSLSFVAEQGRKAADKRWVEYVSSGKIGINVFKDLGLDILNQFDKDLISSTAKTLGKQALLNEVASPGSTLPSETQLGVIVEKLKGLLQQQKKLLPVTKVLQRVEKGKRVAQAEAIYRESTDPKLLGISTGKLKGELPKAMFTPIDEAFSITEKDTILKAVRFDKSIDYFTDINTEEAFNKLLLGQHLARYETKLLEGLFGKDIGKILTQRLTFWEKAQYTTTNIVNFQRSVMTSWDLSAIGRQGLFWLPSKPKEWYGSAKTGYKIMFSKNRGQDVYNTLMSDVRTRPHSQLVKGLGGSYDIGLTDPIGKAASFSKVEEAFMSEWAERFVPGVKRSELAYTGVLNDLRSKLWESFTAGWEGTGKSAADYEALSAFIRHSTGRGDIPKGLTKLAPFLNGVFFAPRFLSSRFETVGDLIFTTSAVRPIVASSLVKYVGTGATVLWGLSHVPGVDVEWNPQSSDFGKIRIGDTRIDFWGGYLPIVRLVTQTITGKRYDTDTKRFLNVERRQVLLNFLRSKLSPPAALAWDTATGSTMFGESILPRERLYTKQGKLDLAFAISNRILPMFYQDILEARRYQGLGAGLLVAPLTWHGFGVQTYPIPDYKQTQMLKNEIALENTGQRWDDLGPEAQKALRDYDGRINLYEDKQRAMDTSAVSGNFLKESHRSSEFIRKNLPKEVKLELDRISVPVPGVGRKIASDWYLKDDLYKRYQELYSKSAVSIFSTIMKEQGWNELNDEQRRNTSQYIFTEIGQAVRKQIMAEANEKDLEHLSQRQEKQ